MIMTVSNTMSVSSFETIAPSHVMAYMSHFEMIMTVSNTMSVSSFEMIAPSHVMTYMRILR